MSIEDQYKFNILFFKTYKDLFKKINLKKNKNIKSIYYFNLKDFIDKQITKNKQEFLFNFYKDLLEKNLKNFNQINLLFLETYENNIYIISLQKIFINIYNYILNSKIS